MDAESREKEIMADILRDAEDWEALEVTRRRFALAGGYGMLSLAVGAGCLVGVTLVKVAISSLLVLAVVSVPAIFAAAILGVILRDERKGAAEELQSCEAGISLCQKVVEIARSGDFDQLSSLDSMDPGRLPGFKLMSLKAFREVRRSQCSRGAWPPPKDRIQKDLFLEDKVPNDQRG